MYSSFIAFFVLQAANKLEFIWKWQNNQRFSFSQNSWNHEGTVAELKFYTSYIQIKIIINNYKAD